MKQFLLFISIIFSTNFIAQTSDPELYQPWYLYSVMASDGSPAPLEVSEIDPTTMPTLTIHDDLTFDGVGVCNTFNGTFNLSNPDIIETESDLLSQISSDCALDIYDELEGAYLSFLEPVKWYSITSEANGKVLSMWNTIFGSAVFKNFPLNSTEFELDRMRIFPNPTSSLIHLKPHGIGIKKIELFNPLGQKVKTIKNKFVTIDISDLSNGVYLMKIDSESGHLDKRIIKN